MRDPEQIIAGLERLQRTIRVMYDRAQMVEDHSITFRITLDVIALADAIEYIRNTSGLDDTPRLEVSDD